MGLPTYEIFAIKYAEREARRADHFVGGDPHDGPMPMDYFIWVVRSPDRLILVDTGFNAEVAARRKRTLVREPRDGLALLGIKSEEVREVIITHMHNDHVGTFFDFPNADFHVQDEEMSFVTGRHMRNQFFRRSFEIEHVVGMVRMVFKDRVVISNIDTAELVKHASNSFLAMKISFINRVADLCERTDADVEMVARGMGLDERIGRSFLKAGLGYGGSCFPKDVKALAKIGSELGVDMTLFRTIDAINDDRVRVFLEKIRKALWILKGKTVGVLGLAFKPETDDIREAPSIKIIRELLKQGAALRLYDPKAADNMKCLFPEDGRAVTYVSSPYEAARDAHILLVVTEWEEIRTLDLARIKALMANPVLVDGRNVYDPAAVRALGFEYASIGRK